MSRFVQVETEFQLHRNPGGMTRYHDLRVLPLHRHGTCQPAGTGASRGEAGSSGRFARGSRRARRFRHAGEGCWAPLVSAEAHHRLN